MEVVVIGAIVGDIIGSRFEFNNRAPIGSHIVGGGATFTDESVCIVGLADALLRNVSLDETMRRWCREYSWVSYGKLFSRWVNDPGAGPYNSLGNGCVARVSVANQFSDSMAEATCLAQKLSALTHNHPESLRVVEVLTRALWRVNGSGLLSDIRNELEVGGFALAWNREELLASRVEFSESVTQIVEPALSAVMVGESFEDVMRICIERGGDTDSICSLAGAFAEAVFGIPHAILLPALAKLPTDMRKVLEKALAPKRNLIIQEEV